MIDRIKEISELDDGWFDGKMGDRIDPSLIPHSIKLSEELSKLNSKLVQYIFPSIEGKIVFEDIESWDIELGINALNDKPEALMCLFDENESVIERQRFDLSDESDNKRFNQLLKELFSK